MTPTADGGRKARLGPALIFEGLLCSLVLAGLAGLALFVFRRGYLPPPFLYDLDDTFMDWFNTAYYAVRGGAFDVWGAIYPPVSFNFLNIFSMHSCYGSDPFFGRHCDSLGRLTILGFYLIDLWLILKCFNMVDKSTAIMRTIALGFGLPMLFTLERGNLIIPCFAAFIIGHSRILRSARWKWLAVALSINFKPYLVVATAPLLLKGKWRWVEGCARYTILVYVASFAIYGSGAPNQLLTNMLTYVTGGGNSYFGALYYGASYKSLLNYIHFGLPLTRFTGSALLDFLEVALPTVIRLGQAAVAVALCAALVRPDRVKTHRLGALGLLFVLTTAEFGGYTEVFIIFFVFHERWRGVLPVIALFCAYVLCVPGDVTLTTLYRQPADVYLTNRSVMQDVNLSFGMFARPGLLVIMEVALATATVADVVSALWPSARARDEGSPRAAVAV